MRVVRLRQKRFLCDSVDRKKKSINGFQFNSNSTNSSATSPPFRKRKSKSSSIALLFDSIETNHFCIFFFYCLIFFCWMKVGNEMELGGFQAAALFTLLIQSVEVSVEGKTRINCTLAFKSLCAIDFFFWISMLKVTQLHWLNQPRLWFDHFPKNEIESTRIETGNDERNHS